MTTMQDQQDAMAFAADRSAMGASPGAGILSIFTRIADTYRVALATPMVLLAVIGCMVTPLGWRLFGALLSPEGAHRDAKFFQTLPGQSSLLNPWMGPVATMPEIPQAPAPPGGAQVAEVKTRTAQWLTTLHRSPRGFPEDPVLMVPYRLMRPFWRVFDRQLSWRVWLFYLLGAVWTIFVWSWCGGAICRMAAVRLGRDERVGFRESLQYARSKWFEFAIGPLLPLIGIALLAVPLVLLGLAMNTRIGLLIGGLAFVPVLLAGLLMAVLGLGTLAAWPLMFGAIASEGSDGFDAISSSFAYVLQRPFAWIGYVLIAALVGMGGWIITTLFCESVLAAGFWGVATGMGTERASQVAGWLNEVNLDSAKGMDLAGVWLISFAMDLARLVASAVSYAHFWCLAVVVYLLLRKDVDDTEFTEIYLEEEDETRLGLPPTETAAPGEHPATVPLHPEDAGADATSGDG